MAAAVLLSSCVKDTLYDTPHPDYGKIAVTADWSARGEGIDIPTTWTVTMGDYTGTETSVHSFPDHILKLYKNRITLQITINIPNHGSMTQKEP